MRLVSIFAPFLLVASVITASSSPSWAEPAYSRKQVEAHLRMLYPSWGEKSFMQERVFKKSSFDALVQRDGIRVVFYKANSQQELNVTLKIIEHLVQNIVGKPVYWTQKGEEFDIAFLVSDELDDVFQTSPYRSFLKGKKTTEEDYEAKRGSMLMMRHLSLETGHHISVLAIERGLKGKTDLQVYGSRIRAGMFRLLASIYGGPVIMPSFADPNVELEHLPPIDLALLYAIYQHDDWPEMDYETRIQRLTDRVLEQLAKITN